MIERFEANRPRLRAIAHRMLGSAAEAEDAVQEAWLRLNRAGDDRIDNLDAWLTTVVGRVCLDMLRSRTTRREDTLEAAPAATEAGPEQEAVLADSVGLALFVVLETLTPVERLAFVLHDLFGVPFDEIAPIVGRTPDASRQLASRARRRIRNHDPATAQPTGRKGVAAQPARRNQNNAQPAARDQDAARFTDRDQDAARPADRRLVDAFLTASRAGDLTTLLTLLDPDVRLRVDETAARLGADDLRGSTIVAQFFAGRARAATPALIDGTPGLWIAPRRLAVLLTVADGRITHLEAIADPGRLRDLEIIPLA